MPDTPPLDLFLGLPVFHSPAQPCPYLPGRFSRALIVAPFANVSREDYQRLSDAGFRRSANQFYRPQCPTCRRCLAARVPVNAFMPTRSQRRNQRQNADITLHQQPARYLPKYFRLYHDYLRVRHPTSEMTQEASPATYTRFFGQGWLDATQLLEFRLDGQVVGIAVTDRLPEGLSAIYTFFENRLANRGLGIHAILSQIALAKRENLAYLYLGYWIANSSTMAYKEQFHPLELLIDDHWQRFGHGEALPVKYDPNPGKR